MEFTKYQVEQGCLKPTLRIMKDGDLVITYERHDSMGHLYLECGKVFDCKFGSFRHDDFIGKPFGTKIVSRTTNGYLYALEPTPQLWSIAIHTRTQIVNDLDSSFIILNLDLFPGCVVVESGTGSGCLSVSLARAIYPAGHLFTYEYNPVRAEQAKEEFRRLGLEEHVTVTCQDVCAKFDHETCGGFAGIATHSVDAVLLDLPEPWHAIEHALDVLKPGRTLCSYSPCIEQVLKTCEYMRKHSFHSIRMVEVRQRPFDGRHHVFENADVGRPTQAAVNAGDPCVGDSADKLDESNGGNNADDAIIVNNCNEGDGDDCDGSIKGVSCALDGVAAFANELNASEVETEVVLLSGKRQRFIENEGVNDEHSISGHGHNGKTITIQDESNQHSKKGVKYYTPRVVPTTPMTIARPIVNMQGHTAYLTFAVSPVRKGLALPCFMSAGGTTSVSDCDDKPTDSLDTSAG